MSLPTTSRSPESSALAAAPPAGAKAASTRFRAIVPPGSNLSAMTRLEHGTDGRARSQTIRRRQRFGNPRSQRLSNRSDRLERTRRFAEARACHCESSFIQRQRDRHHIAQRSYRRHGASPQLATLGIVRPRSSAEQRLLTEMHARLNGVVARGSVFGQ